MTLFRTIARLAFVLTLVVMLMPYRHVLGVDLGDMRLQAGVFGLTMFLWALSRSREPWDGPADPYGSNTTALHGPLPSLRRNIVIAAVELACIAAIGEICQAIEPHRHGALGEFLINASSIAGVGLLSYLAGLLLIARARRIRVAPPRTKLSGASPR